MILIVLFLALSCYANVPVKKEQALETHADIDVEPVVELADRYTEITFINCNGRLAGDKVYLTDIPAFGFSGFEVK